VTGSATSRSGRRRGRVRAGRLATGAGGRRRRPNLGRHGRGHARLPGRLGGPATSARLRPPLGSLGRARLLRAAALATSAGWAALSPAGPRSLRARGASSPASAPSAGRAARIRRRRVDQTPATSACLLPPGYSAATPSSPDRSR
jgi:hypothetical protein